MYFSEIDPHWDFSNRVKRTRKILKKQELFQEDRKEWTQLRSIKQSDNVAIKKGNKKNGESFIRSSYKFIYVFFSSSSIHGFYHLTPIDRHWFEHCIWLICIALGLCGCAYIGSKSWNRYQKDPTVISMERDYKQWNTTLPSVTLCPTTRIERYTEVEPNELGLSINKTTVLKFMEMLAELNFGYLEATKKKLFDLPGIKPEDYMNLTYTHRYMFYHTPNEYIDFKDGYPVPSITENGVCYIYNSEIAYTLSVPYFFDNDINNLPGKLPENSARIIVEGGRLDGDLIAQIHDINSGFEVAVTGPEEIPDSASKWKTYRIRNFTTYELVALSLNSAVEIKSLNVEQRHCRFTDESNLKISKVYSYNLCRMECRMNLVEKLCNCVPYFYRRIEGKKICGINDYPCLIENEDYLWLLRNMTTNEKVKCNCLPPCNDVNYYIDYERSKIWALGTVFKWGIIKFPKYRLKREIIFSFSDLLVSIGGTAGLFLGCSVLSFIEIIYFFTLRLLMNICSSQKRR